MSNIVLFFLGDVANRVATMYDSSFLRYTGASKALGLVLNAIFIIKYRLYKKEYAKALLVCIMLLVFVFIVSNLLLKDIDVFENLKANTLFLLYACFLPFLLIPFFSINRETTNIGLNILLNIFWFNIIFIIIGSIFDFPSLRTYFYGERFGYKGLLERSTYASYLFIFTIIYYYYNWQVYRKRHELFCVLLAILVSLFIGTKRVYLFLALLGIFHFFYGKLYLKRWFYLVLTGIIVLGVVFRSFILNLINDRFELFIKIYHNEGFLTSFTSYRSNLLVDYVNTFVENRWSALNYVFGGGFFDRIHPEMDLIDAYLFFGVLGPSIYIFIYRKYMFNYKIKSPIVWFYLLLIIILAFLSSGIIFTADFAIPLILLSSYFYFEQKGKEI